MDSSSSCIAYCPEQGEHVKYTDAEVPHSDAAHAAHRELKQSHDNTGYRFARDVAPGSRVNFSDDNSQWTSVTGCTNMWGSHKRPNKLDPHAPKTWQVWYPEPEEGQQRPEEEDEFDFDANRPLSPTLTVRTNTTSMAGGLDMDALIDFDPDPTEIDLSSDSPRLLSLHHHCHSQLGKVSTRDGTRKKVVKHHDGPDQGQKKARHRGLESFTMPHKFGRTGRVRHRKQGAYLLKQTESVRRA